MPTSKSKKDNIKLKKQLNVRTTNNLSLESNKFFPAPTFRTLNAVWHLIYMARLWSISALPCVLEKSWGIHPVGNCLHDHPKSMILSL